MLLLAGGEDAVTASYLYARQILAGLPHNHAPHKYLYYPHAGHGVLGIPYTPLSPQDTSGGTNASDNAAYSQDWPAAINYISHH